MDTLKNILGLIVSLSSVFGIFTGIINKMFSKKLKPLEDRIEQEHTDSIKKDMSQLRYTVVSFASDLHNGIPKTRFEFDAIFQFIAEYENIIKQLKIKNGLFEEEVVYIKQKYHELMNS